MEQKAEGKRKGAPTKEVVKSDDKRAKTNSDSQAALKTPEPRPELVKAAASNDALTADQEVGLCVV